MGLDVKRHSDWQTTLDSFLRSHANTPFQWGENDCSLFAANAVQCMSSVDIADDFRGKYADEASAFALIKSVTGGAWVADAIVHCAQKHGLNEWTGPDGKPLPLMAKRGDLCAVSNDTNVIAGIVDLSGRYVACMSESGVVRLRLSNVVRAWRV